MNVCGIVLEYVPWHCNLFQYFKIDSTWPLFNNDVWCLVIRIERTPTTVMSTRRSLSKKILATMFEKMMADTAQYVFLFSLHDLFLNNYAFASVTLCWNRKHKERQRRKANRSQSWPPSLKAIKSTLIWGSLRLPTVARFIDDRVEFIRVKKIHFSNLRINDHICHILSTVLRHEASCGTKAAKNSWGKCKGET